MIECLLYIKHYNSIMNYFRNQGESNTMRINQYIAHCGISSRRKADQLIEEGRVIVNGKKVTSPGMQVEEGNDMVKVDGKIISSEANQVYYMLNKPLRYISAVSDDR